MYSTLNLTKNIEYFAAVYMDGKLPPSVVLVKAFIDIEAPENGWFETISLKEGDSFASGAVLATFEANF
jgi:multidrug efflux pump subunit AcrA (membrane-fusion protein)